jgi:hypothetical protein
VLLGSLVIGSLPGIFFGSHLTDNFTALQLVVSQGF